MIFFNWFLDFRIHIRVTTHYPQQKHGSNVEKKLYNNCNIIDLMDRITTKRALEFVGHSDSFELRDKNTSGSGLYL